MKITVLTLFKNVFDDYLQSSIIKRAIEKQKVEIKIVDFRAYSTLSNKQVDDYQYGGGAGMVLMLEPIVKAIRDNGNDAYKILLTPSGKTLQQDFVKELSTTHKHIMLICGHYEGFDERIKNYVDACVSIGDYVLTGGELPALVIIDSITRLIDDVINNESLTSESFNDGLLDHPVYTKPVEFEGHKVPEVLLSGNHQKIKAYRQEQRIIQTKLNRPDLYEQYKKANKGE